jgi:hypothetical protein
VSVRESWPVWQQSCRMPSRESGKICHNRDTAKSRSYPLYQSSKINFTLIVKSTDRVFVSSLNNCCQHATSRCGRIFWILGSLWVVISFLGSHNLYFGVSMLVFWGQYWRHIAVELRQAPVGRRSLPPCRGGGPKTFRWTLENCCENASKRGLNSVESGPRHEF